MLSTQAQSETIQATFDRAKQLQSEGKLEEALSNYRSILDLDPNHLAAWHQVAQILENQGKFAEAIAAYRTAIELDSQPPFWIYRHLGFSLDRQGLLDEAIVAYQKTIALQPEDAATYGLLGQVFGKKGDLEQAIASYQQEIELSERVPVWVYLNLGEALLQCDRPEEAIAAYEKAHKQEPNNAGIAKLRASAQLKLNRPAAPSNTAEIAEIAETQAPEPIVENADLIVFKRQTKATPATAKPAIQDLQTLKIRASRQLIPDLYAAAIQLFIAPADRPFLETLQPLTGIVFYQFHFDAKDRSGIITPIDRPIETDLVELQWAPMFCHGFLTASDAGQTQLQPLIDWWSQRVPPAQLPPNLTCQTHSNPAQLKAAFWELMFHQTARETTAISTRLSVLQKQYMELRAIHETMHNSFAAIEGFLSQAKLPGLQLTFDSQPTQKNIVLEPGVGTGQIEQWLPVSSRGLAALEFHVSKCSPHAKGQLTVSIHSRDEATRLAQWQIPYEHLTPGWFQLDLPSIDIARKQEVAARIEWNTRIGPAPHLSLTQAQPICQAQVRVNHQTLDRSLALRVWTGLPGSRRSFSPYLTMADPETDLPQDFSGGHLGQRTLSRLVEVTPNLPTEDFLHIQILENGRKLLTHPRQQSLTLAKLPFCCPAGATVIKATVATENDRASTIEYGMALIAPGESEIACFQNNDPAPAVAFSGWIPVEPETPRQIVLSLPNAADRPYHIVFGTRSPDGSIQFGWAHWLDFQIA
jgi:tetratricopeptide (TPR) repeat protein